MRSTFLTAIILPVMTLFVQGQVYKPYITIPVFQNNKQLLNPWTGGLDAPIIQEIDLNGDGIKDLFIFEKTQSTGFHRWTTYINHGTPNLVDYHYAPEYESKFPSNMHDWVLLVDYDCDGQEDIFTYNYNGGFSVYHNDFTPGQGLSFSLYISLVYSDYWGFPANLFVASVNQPALIDIDGDGDLDILTVSLSANNIELHRNYAMENYGRCDTLVYILEKSCWGLACLSAFSNSAIIDCHNINLGCTDGPHKPAGSGQAYYESMRNRTDSMLNTQLHNGSCMVAFDLNGDGVKDVVNGDILGNTLLAMYNGGTPDSAHITAQDSLFPVNSVPADLKTFPGPYFMDVNNDGLRDFLVTPCTYNGTVNIKNILYYKNTGSGALPVFAYQGDSLFVNEMIDVGSGANVTVADLDGDGLQDLVIGNFAYVYQNSPDNTKISWYKNTGTSTQPQFTLADDDLAAFSQVGIFGAYPAFGDLDNDGDPDMIVAGSDGYLNYYENTAGAGNPPNFILAQAHIQNSSGTPINMGAYPTPILVDLNRDGKLDLIIGERIGNLNYFENTGTLTSYSFTLITQTLGNVSTVKPAFDFYGYSAPFFHDDNGNYELYCGSLSGYIYKYDNIDGNLNGTFNLVDSMFLREPIRSTVSGADIDNDGYFDLVIGNYAGGVKWYSNGPVSVNELQPGKKAFILFPNPASTQISIMLDNEIENIEKRIEITDLTGRLVYSESNNYRTSTVDVSKWSSGMYICRIIGNKINSNQRFILTR
ncbi:MAG: T9SS type A sorting domain-containing protein [Bacteroidia bacterium]|nr:T9SS type A sorting domain-containing protein [Bacteroidia bacterium]